MLKLSERVSSLKQLGEYLSDLETPEISAIKHSAENANRWFTISNIDQALISIRDQFLKLENIRFLVDKYKLDDHIKPVKIGLVMAGNIPVVGFHDVLCCYLVGHKSLIKFSEKDTILLQFLISKLKTINPANAFYFENVEKLVDYEAVIATGSNNTATHFEYYFRNLPHIIRRNRTSIAILSGQESKTELYNLGKDIFSYFGLGCRNVSAVLVPEGYEFGVLFEAFEPFQDIIHHNKYKNNYDFALALFLLNREDFKHNEFLIVKESEHIASRISCLNYKIYHNENEIKDFIELHKDEIQCIVSSLHINDVETVNFGDAQNPAIDTFADGVDTMQFLLSF